MPGANEEVLNFAVIGCGTIAPTHIGAIRQIDNVHIHALSDSVPERAYAMAAQFDIQDVYTKLEDLIGDPMVDIVSICTPSGTHADIAVAALRAGKHVIVEKPMDISLAACDRMIAAADETGKKLTVISQHRFDHATQYLKAALGEGKLGKIVLADASVKWWRTQEYYDSGDWRGTWAMDGGGALMNQGVHTVDLLQWLAGDVESIYAHTRTAAHERIEVEDVVVAALTFASGAIGTLTATTAAFPGLPVRIDIFGAEGSATIEADTLRSLILKQGDTHLSDAISSHAVSVAQGGSASVVNAAAERSAAADPGAVWGDAHRAQIEDFLRAVRTDGTPLIDARAGRKPLEIILAVYESARTGQAVKLGAASQ
ncbi:oxidoreductase [Capsulimonas corticalis]|uniref:Oxidoreductase n=1 Tax=Capsulimonas corticalis TaxID=2219043 RepID=A0A402D116_9BACT|nr:Gfo/Idh/MocA family oxidoreductase [Capsulimonas corticalis]BDI31751.1 oxidoreductase [Capsulimonas corticalis]